jgi:hypothetical protein
MVVGKWKAGWLAGIVVLLGMLGIFQLENFFPGNGLEQRVIRVAIDISALAVVPLVAWLWQSPLWRSPGERGIPMRWIRFFAIAVLGFPIVAFWLIPFIFRHPSLANPVSRFVDWAGDWLPVFVAAPIVGYSIWRSRREPS